MKRKDKKTTRRVLVCTHIHVHSHGMYAVDIVYIVEVESSTSFKNIFYRFTFFKDAVCVCAQQYHVLLCSTGSACVTSYISRVVQRFLLSKNGQNHVPCSRYRVCHGKKNILHNFKIISHAVYSMLILKLLLDSL